jgi:L-lactate dehydrogenase
MTCMASHYASEHGLPGTRVLGTGTMLDTARFRSLLGLHVGVDPQHVHGYVIGEHGDSEVLTWSLTTVGSMHLADYCSQQDIPLDERIREDIDKKVRNAAYEIIEGKGATYYGIGSALARIADVILHDQRSILTVSTAHPKDPDLSGICISMPHLVGGEGIISSIPLLLDNEERERLKKSAGKVRSVVDEIKTML